MRADDEPAAVVVRGLRKTYGPVAAVAGVDFDVRRGEVFGLLGPNLAVLAIWGLVGLLVALRFFRWEPRG